MSHSLVHTSVSSNEIVVTNVFVLLWEMEQLYWNSFPNILHVAPHALLKGDEPD